MMWPQRRFVSWRPRAVGIESRMGERTSGEPGAVDCGWRVLQGHGRAARVHRAGAAPLPWRFNLKTGAVHEDQLDDVQTSSLPSRAPTRQRDTCT